MGDEQKAKKEYLKWRFDTIQGEDIGLQKYGDIEWFELRGYTYEEARQEVFNKYRARLLNDDEITRTIVEYRDFEVLISEAFEEMPKTEFNQEELNKRYIEYLCRVFSTTCDFTIKNRERIDPDGVVDQIMEIFIANEIVQGFVKQKEYRESQLRQYENLMNSPETKVQILGRNITKHGFLELPKVASLTDDSKAALIEKISASKIPYIIAMFDFLGFIKHLETPPLRTKDQLYKEISKWLNSDIDGRAVKGNIASLNEHSKEDKDRYTAHKHIKKVAKDYEILK